MEQNFLKRGRQLYIPITDNISPSLKSKPDENITVKYKYCYYDEFNCNYEYHKYDDYRLCCTNNKIDTIKIVGKELYNEFLIYPERNYLYTLIYRLNTQFERLLFISGLEKTDFSVTSVIYKIIFKKIEDIKKFKKLLEVHYKGKCQLDYYKMEDFFYEQKPIKILY